MRTPFARRRFRTVYEKLSKEKYYGVSIAVVGQWLKRHNELETLEE